MPRLVAPGFTLVEILAALALGGVLLMLAVPGYRAWVADLEMRDRIEALVVTMSRARSEALKRQARVALCPSSDGQHCATGGRWEDGWIVFADRNDDGDRDDDETIIAVESASRPGITIRGNKPVSQYVSYTSYGHTRMANGALQMGTLTVCRPGSKAVDVVLANGGRVRVDRTKTTCGRRKRIARDGGTRAMRRFRGRNMRFRQPPWAVEPSIPSAAPLVSLAAGSRFDPSTMRIATRWSSQ